MRTLLQKLMYRPAAPLAMPAPPAAAPAQTEPTLLLATLGDDSARHRDVVRELEALVETLRGAEPPKPEPLAAACARLAHLLSLGGGEPERARAYELAADAIAAYNAALDQLEADPHAAAQVTSLKQRRASVAWWLAAPRR